jgi:hypothetical protein
MSDAPVDPPRAQAQQQNYPEGREPSFPDHGNQHRTDSGEDKFNDDLQQQSATPPTTFHRSILP